MIVSVSDGTSNSMMMLVLVLAATVIMIMLLRRHQFRASTQRDLGREQLARIREQRGLRQSMDELLLQLEDVSRRVGAQVDTKFAKLETVIRDADERIDRLERILGRPATGNGSPDAARDQPDAKPRQAAPPAQPTHQAGGRASASRKLPATEPTDPRVARVYELVDAGATPIKAAEQLGLPLGEVELILNLRKLR
jgi:hypothetical protein